MLALGNVANILAKDVSKTAAEVIAEPMYSPPSPPPKEWANWLVQQLDAKMFEILCANKVPYFILKGFADDEWGDISLLLTRWPNIADLYDDAKDTLDIKTLPPKEKEKIRARLASALEDLKYYKERKREEQAMPAGRHQVDTNDRRAIEEAFARITDEYPRLENQGGPHMLGKLMAAAATGQVFDMPIKDMVPYHPAPWIKVEEVWEPGPYGKMELSERKTRPPPTTPSHWKDMMRLWYTTLMMALAANSHQPALKVDKDWWRRLRRFYEDFLFGEAILTRPNPPLLHQLMLAERKAWQRIAALMWSEARTIQAALEEVWTDHLWWQSLLEQRAPSDKGYYKGAAKGGGVRGGSARGGGGRGYQAYAAPTHVRQPGKGRGRGGGKGRGKNQRNDLAARQTRQRGAGRQIPADGGAQATDSTSQGKGQHQGQTQNAGPRIPVQDWPPLAGGKQRCRDFHIRGDCPRGAGCQHSHKCPGCGRGNHSLAHCRNI